jgi:hypothetical protein
VGSRPKAPKPPPAPPPPPDLAGQAIRDAAAKERQRQLGTSGRKSTFLSGAAGDQSFISKTVKSLLGS